MVSTRTSSYTAPTVKPRDYDIVIFGATGYTGLLTAQHLAANAPTNISWAVAGRSQSKLDKLVNDLKDAFPDRKQPGTIVSSLEPSELDAMAKQTKVLITTVGPYSLYGTPVVEACVNNGTSYVDCTGENTWYKEICDKFHEKAKVTGAIIIPECAVESAPPDMLSFLVVNYIQNHYLAATKKVVGTIHHIKSGISGGTLASAFGILDSYSMKEVGEASRIFAGSIQPVPEHDKPTRPPQVTSEPELGALSLHPAAACDRNVVMRSWSLYQYYGGDEIYGKSFTYAGYLTRSNMAFAYLWFVTVTVGFLFIFSQPFKYFVRRLVTQPGSGPQLDLRASHTQRDAAEWRVVGEALNDKGERAVASFAVDLDMYSFTGVTIVEAALVLLDQMSASSQDATLSKKIGGGVLTPASLGWPYFERLEKQGCRITVGPASDVTSSDWSKLQSWPTWNR